MARTDFGAAGASPRGSEPTTGELDLESRNALRHIGRGTEITRTEQQDVYEVEYRKLRLEKVVLVGVWGDATADEIDASMQELAALAETAGSEVLEILYQRRDRPDPGTYVGSGKVAELADVVAATGADTVIADGELSPGQLVSLEEKLNAKVIDRTMLILDIFAQHASSKEGKAQVSLAQLEYLFNRARGWGGNLSRQAGGRAGSNGGVGLRGPGETKIETDRRRIRAEMARLRKELAHMKTSREVKRAKRGGSLVPQVAVAGYTNAGKSSLINALTGAGVLVEDALFATLDPTTRHAKLADGRSVTFTDTVGFVRHLPTQLVESFKSSLEELLEADVMVHVVDGAAAMPLAQIEAVRSIVAEVAEDAGQPAPPEILVVNKIDAADPVTLAELRHQLRECHFVSAATGEGIDELESAIELFLNSLETRVRLLVPYTRGDVVSRVHRLGSVLGEDYLPDGTAIEALVPSRLASELAEFARENDLELTLGGGEDSAGADREEGGLGSTGEAAAS